MLPLAVQLDPDQGRRLARFQALRRCSVVAVLGLLVLLPLHRSASLVGINQSQGRAAQAPQASSLRCADLQRAIRLKSGDVLTWADGPTTNTKSSWRQL